MEPEKTLEIVSKENKFLQLPASVSEIITAMETYQDLLKKLLIDEDYAVILNKKCIKKSGWLKLALAFNLSIKITGEKKEIDPVDSSHYSYHITVECIAPNGRTTSELGTCDTNEKKESEHVIRSMAMTRAKSRAIASMIGASESSAEEMEAVKDTQNTTPGPVAEHYLEILSKLGYEGIPPKTSFEASELIKELKSKAKENTSKESESTSVDCTCDNSIPSSINPNICQTCGKLLENKS